MIRIDSLLTGRIAPLGPQNRPSGIAKYPVDSRIHLSRTGLDGDEQADLKNHGGIEKAVHHYARDHYVHWQNRRTPHPAVLDHPGAFGENISTFGMTEDQVCLGDIYEVGGAILQVSQARQPCWKLNSRFGDKSMATAVQASRYSGWYYRVLQTGGIAQGDALSLVDRPCEDWPLTRLMAIIYDKSKDRDDLLAMAGLELLAPSWRALAEKRLKTNHIEDWKKRLGL